ncbi:MAG: tripartite tricarboxylate transporter substrate-binding protein [Burkholderiales bacterium]|nr:tripartite tricarboxylate transporter substrate-binding protein [Burkholderiales bacterium]
MRPESRGARAGPVRPGRVSAEGRPDRPVRIVVSFAPGSGNDLIARQLAPKLAESLGQPVVVGSRAGDGGGLGTEAVVRAARDAAPGRRATEPRAERGARRRRHPRAAGRLRRREPRRLDAAGRRRVRRRAARPMDPRGPRDADQARMTARGAAR